MRTPVPIKQVEKRLSGILKVVINSSGRAMVYCICPGAVDTEMYRSMFMDIPVLKPEHVAEKVLELALPESNVLSGSVIEVYAPPIPQM